MPRNSRFVDMTGKTFGKWTVVREYGTSNHGDIQWVCKCECGTERILFGHSLRSGSTLSCGCVSRLTDLTGRLFGKLVVLGLSHIRKTPSGQTKHYWTCLCECGTVKAIQGQSLKSGHATSCGCHKSVVVRQRCTTHGCASHALGRTATYRCWASLKDRCLNPRSTGWKHYGARGISICERWMNSFENFLADMGESPVGLTIERIDPNGNYEPSNCRWATRKEQTRNTRRNRMVTLNGETLCLSAWIERLGLNHHTVAWRLSKGMSAEEALTIPVRSKIQRRCPQMDLPSRSHGGDS